MKTNTSKEKKFYTQGQRFAARILFILWLLASVNPESVLAIPKRQPATTSPGDPSLASTPPTPLPGGILQLPPDAPGSFWGDSVASSPSTDAALQRQRPSSLLPRTLDKLTSRVWGPRPQATPRPLAGPVAEGYEAASSSNQHPTVDLSSAVVAPSTATPSALKQLMNQVDVLDNHTFGQGLNAAMLPIHYSNAESTTQKELLTKLGAIALIALAQETDQISDKTMQAAIEGSPITLEMLVETGLLQVAGAGQYQFSHQRIHEYFAGRSLAKRLLSKDKHERMSVSGLFFKHKYESQYTRLLSFMASEMSSIAEIEGIEQLLTLLGEEQEVVGLQHLLLQLRVVHEWLCVAEKTGVDPGISSLEANFQLFTSLKQWFIKAFNHLRRGGSWHISTGQKLLGLLKDSLQRFDSVASHSSDLFQFQLLRRVAKDESMAVRKTIFSILVDPPAAWASASLSIIRELLEDEDRYAGIATLRTFLSLTGSRPSWAPEALVLIRSFLQDSYSYARKNALKDLSSLIQVAPGESEAALGIIQSSLQDEEDSVRSVALGVLSTLIQVAPGHSEAALGIIQSSLQDRDGNVRSAALGVLSALIQVAPEHSEAALGIIQSSLQDGDGNVRRGALEALSALIQVAPEHSEAALGIIQSPLQDKSRDVVKVSFDSLPTLVQVVPERYQAVFSSIQSAFQDGPWRTCLASYTTLATLIQIDPKRSAGVFKIIRELLEDKDPDIREITLDALPKLVQVAPGWSKYALEITLSALQDAYGSVRKAAFRSLGRASLEQLLEYYWSREDRRLIPYITPGLYYTPLVVSKSLGENYHQVTLYTTEGTSCQWLQPQKVTDRFIALVKDEASQMEELLPVDKIDQRIWERYYGAVDSEPCLPADIEEIMDSPCPFWEGKRVKDTHLLVLIPEQVNGKSLTLDYLGELIKSPQGEGHATKYYYYWDGIGEVIGSQASGSSYWVLMTKDVLPESRNKRYEDQRKLVADHANRTGLGYKVPGALEAAVVVLLHHVRSGERLYSDNPYTYTRCQENVQNFQLVVGGFSSGGLSVSNDLYDYDDFGVAGLRKF